MPRSGDRLAHDLGKMMLQDQQRVGEIVAHWVRQMQDFAPATGDVISFFFNYLVHENVVFSVHMNGVNFFKHSVFHLPLRCLRKAELSCLQALMRTQGAFQCNADMQGFSLRYTRFKYDTILSQKLDRILFIQSFIEMCIATFLPHAQSTVQKVLAEYCTEAGRTFGLKNHPHQRGLIQLARLYCS